MASPFSPSKLNLIVLFDCFGFNNSNSALPNSILCTLLQTNILWYSVISFTIQGQSNKAQNTIKNNRKNDISVIIMNDYLL